MAPKKKKSSAAPLSSSSPSRRARPYQLQRPEQFSFEANPVVDPKQHQQQLRGGTVIKKPNKKDNKSITGIERSYESVTKAILTAASSFGASSTLTATPTTADSAAAAAAGDHSRKNNNNNTNSADALNSNPPPPPPPSYNTNNKHGNQHRIMTTATISHSNTNLSSDTTTNTTTNTATAAAARASIGASLLYASASMSHDEFEKLRDESRKLRQEHAVRCSDAGLLLFHHNHHVANSFHFNNNNNKLVQNVKAKAEEETVAVPLADGVGGAPPSFEESEEEEVVGVARSTVTTTASTGRRKSSIETNIPSGMHSSKLPPPGHSHHHHLGGGKVVKLTSDGLSKIRDILHIGNTSWNDDAMSFYCSDDKTGKVVRQRISLANNPPPLFAAAAGGGTEEGTCRRGSSSRAMPQSPMMKTHHHHHHSDDVPNDNEKHNSLFVRLANPMIEAATKTADHALPLLEATTKTAVRATIDGVDVAARTVAKVAVQSVEGVGMLAKDLANAKTPARSNVTTTATTTMHHHYHRRHHYDTNSNIMTDEMGRYADYVHDPNYTFVRTPTNYHNDAGDDALHYANKAAPPVLAGAIAAAKCDLSPTNPNSLEFHEGGIPRVLVVHNDWEERAGFVRSSAEEAVDAGGEREEVQQFYHYSIEAKNNVPPGNRRISNPVDVDEETATINGEEVDVEVMSMLKMGIMGAVEDGDEGIDDNNDDDDAFDQTRWVQGYYARQSHEPATTNNAKEHDDIESGGGDYDDPRNASMWVAVPENYMEDDAPDDYLDTTILRARDVLHMSAGRELSNNQDYIDEEEDDDEEDGDHYERVMNADDVNMGELLSEDNDDDKADFSPSSAGSHTFFVGNVNIGFESDVLDAAPPKNDNRTTNTNSKSSPASFVGNIHVGIDSDISPPPTRMQQMTTTTSHTHAKRDGNHQVLVDDAKSWTTETLDERSDAVTRCTRLEDFDVYKKVTSDQVMKEEDSLTCLANALAAAVIKDNQRKEEKKEFEPSTIDSNRQAMFDLREQRDQKANECGENYASLYLNPSESTDLSHSPPVRVIGGGNATELRINPSESTDLSLFSNWAGETPKKDCEAALSLSSSNDGSRRELKGRIILVRIKKKLFKFAKKILFIKWNKKDCGGIGATPESFMNIPSPVIDYPDPFSPSSNSVGASVSSSIMTGVGSSKRIIGAVPHKVGSPSHAQKLYGTIQYGNHSSEDRTVDGGDSLPPQPKCMPRSNKIASAGNEDEFNYLVEAMMKGRCADDEDSILLYVTPKVDGTGEEVQFIRSMDGTPVPFREIIDDADDVEGKENDATTSEVKPNNLSCLFTNEKGTTAMTTIEIVDAVEVDGQIVLSPHQVNNNVAHVFRRSYPQEPNANLLPGSVIDSECDDSDTLCYHDGCTVIHQTSTFGDNTISTDPSTRPPKGKTTTPSNNAMGIGTPILSPDGPPLTWQAKKNGSFLFSPNNMGRADPNIRAKERAYLKNGKVMPSITMLPSTKSVKPNIPSGEKQLLAIKQRYSNLSIESMDMQNQPTESKPILSFVTCDYEAFAVKNTVSTDKSTATAASDHQAEFKVLLNEFQGILDNLSSDGSSKDDEPSPIDVHAPTLPFDMAATSSTFTSNEGEMQTPVVDNALKRTFKMTPYPLAEVTSVDERRLSSPIVVALNATSSHASITSTTSESVGECTGRKTPFSAEKRIPKSALKTRKGLVKDRVNDIQHRMVTTASTSPTNGAVTDVNGRLKRNHSYRSKKSRRMTNGDGVLAPRKAVLQTTYIRSVPIGIAKSYSRDSREEKEPQKEQHGNSYAAKYTMEVTKLNGNSPDSIKIGGDSSIISDASSYVSETTEYDPFNSLLGKMTSFSADDEQSSATVGEYAKENNADASSSSNNSVLPFKSSMLVRPTEIHQRVEEFTRAPLSPVLMPVKARSWRELAVKAAAAEKTKGNNNGNSSRFRSEQSWREVSRM